MVVNDIVNSYEGATVNIISLDWSLNPSKLKEALRDVTYSLQYYKTSVSILSLKNYLQMSFKDILILGANRWSHSPDIW
jgi:hypothetical protein